MSEQPHFFIAVFTWTADVYLSSFSSSLAVLAGSLILALVKEMQINQNSFSKAQKVALTIFTANNIHQDKHSFF